MKNLFKILPLVIILIGFSQCGKKDEPSPEPESDPVKLLVYEPNSFRDFKSNQLQASVMKSNLQFSTFGDMTTGAAFGYFNKAYAYNTTENKEVFMLFDEIGEPAYLYNIDLSTGQKKESVVEFERSDANNFYVRFFYYDWTNRLGTLLFETLITKSGDSYISTPTFEIENFNTKGSPVQGKKGNISFPVPLKRMEKLMQPLPIVSNLKKTNGGIDAWKSSFDQMRNSTIADWLTTVQKTGAAIALTGLGLSETVIGAPAGAWLIAGGGAMVVGSLAIETFVTEKWSNFLSETQSKVESLSNDITEIAGNSVQKFQGYAQNVKDHWLNPNTNKTSLDDIVVTIEEDEIIIETEDLNDLPDKNGVLQIGLSWNTVDTDVDLWVTDPFGETISYMNETSASGGYLDRDDTDGYGPENIYWLTNIPDGHYRIQVNYYSGAPVVTSYQVKVTNGLGFSASFNGTLTIDDQTDNVITIQRNGSQITY